MSNGVWTDNWRATKNLMMLGCIQPGLTTLKTAAGVTLTDTEPDHAYRTVSPFAAYTGADSQYTAFQGGANMIRLGTSDATPAASDYRITLSDSIREVSVGNESVSFDVPNGSATRAIDLIVENVGASAVTLREWGVYQRVMYITAHTANWTNHVVLVYRALLDSPLTLAPGETAALRLTLAVTLSDPL